jgi:hypothetical protein
MSYPVELDEYTDEALRAELARRHFAQREGKCSYCGRPLRSEPRCRFPERHELYAATDPRSILNRS